MNSKTNEIDVVALDDVRAAATRIAGGVVRTPLLAAPWGRDGQPLWLKPENLQAVGSFKVRGALNTVRSLDAGQRARGVVTHSSGNHARALAYVARSEGVPVTTVLPMGAPAFKVAAVAALGATVIQVGQDEREAYAMSLAGNGMTFVSPDDHPRVVAGQGTVGLEIATDLPQVAAVLVPISGGGLISGIVAALSELCPRARIIGVQPERSAHAADSIRTGVLADWPAERTERTVADGLRMGRLGALPWRMLPGRVHDVITVTDEQILDTVRTLGFESRLVVEPSGAAASAAYRFHGDLLPLGPVVAVVSGGNIDPAAYTGFLSSSHLETSSHAVTDHIGL